MFFSYSVILDDASRISSSSIWARTKVQGFLSLLYWLLGLCMLSLSQIFYYCCDLLFWYSCCLSIYVAVNECLSYSFYERVGVYMSISISPWPYCLPSPASHLIKSMQCRFVVIDPASEPEIPAFSFPQISLTIQGVHYNTTQQNGQFPPSQRPC
jgi:hypothetical protein